MKDLFSPILRPFISDMEAKKKCSSHPEICHFKRLASMSLKPSRQNGLESNPGNLIDDHLISWLN